jgi:YidC/Oxa1 family membrane protein insertase
MDERRLLLAVALSLLVLTAYSLLFPPARREAPAPPGAGAVVPSPPSPPAPAAAPAARAVPAVPAVRDDRERRVEVAGPDLQVAFTNRGARLLSWRLTRYKDVRGNPEEMVQTAPGGPRPLDLETGDAALDVRLREALFRPSAHELALSESRDATLRFEYAEADLVAHKTLEFGPRGYLASLSVSVKRGGQELAKKVLWGPGLGNPTPEEMEVQGYQAPQGVVLAEGGVDRRPVEKLGSAQAIMGARWVGIESHYFAALLVDPRGRGTAELRAQSLPPLEDGKPRQAPLAALDLGTGEGPALLYVGPKDYHALSKLPHRLAEVVPVGDWIGPIVVPFMGLLRWVHGFVGNYGWSIVVLTLVINLAMAPLRHYSIANGIKMQKMAPEMKVIQERYRKVPLLDPKRQQMQQEMAALYAKHGMSMGTQMTVGCLPLLLTMPFLIAFYRVLQVSIELRGARFLWVADLSQKDPYFLTPIFMGLSMLVMTRLTPSTLDPTQQRIMLIMPLMLVGMFLWAPAGLNLYWLASNLCSIVQQGVTLSVLRPRPPEGGKKERRRR